MIILGGYKANKLTKKEQWQKENVLDRMVKKGFSLEMTLKQRTEEESAMQ